MKRRCTFLEKTPAFLYNTGEGEYLGGKSVSDTSNLGFLLMSTMLKEVCDFCNNQHDMSQIAYMQVCITYTVIGTFVKWLL